jgi:GMP synthase (glutamine-hydrolysing)
MIDASRRVLVVHHQDDCPAALVSEWLVEAGCRLDVRRPYSGRELLADLSDLTRARWVDARP